MGKSLAELRQSPHVGAVEQVYPICVAGKLVAKYEEARAAAAEAAEREPKGKPGRIGAKSRVRELIEAAEAIREEMNDHLVLVKFRAKPPHAWREWVAAHPPREGEKLDRQADLNFDALVASLGEFVVAINEDDPQAGDWDFIAEGAAWGDLKNAATIVFNMHHMAVDIPKSLMSLLTDPESSDDFE